MRLTQGELCLVPRYTTDLARQDVGQQFAAAQILEANRAHASACRVRGKREQIFPRADFPGPDQERRLPFGQRVGIDENLFGRVQRAALARVDGVVLSLHEAGVVEVVALAKWDRLVTLENAALELGVEPVLQGLSMRPDCRGVGVLVCEE